VLLLSRGCCIPLGPALASLGGPASSSYTYNEVQSVDHGPEVLQEAT
jgi:hypothetical protein